MRDSSRIRPTLAAFSLVASLTWACDRGSEDVREWSPRDHDHTTSPSQGQVDAAQPASAVQQEHGISDVVLATWKQNCVTCHGVIGRGDGPQGRMLRPPDFTHPVWQKNARDDHMRRTIVKGRGAMPAFGHLPEETVDGLLRLIRLLNRDRSNTEQQPSTDAPSAAPSAAPSSPPASPAAPSPAQNGGEHSPNQASSGDKPPAQQPEEQAKPSSVVPQ